MNLVPKMKFKLFTQIAVLGLAFVGLTTEVEAQTPARTYQIDWSFDGIQYETLVQLRGHSGLMRVRFVDPVSGSYRLVQMVARVEFNGEYYILSGKYPRDPFSGHRDLNYLPDYLWFSAAPNGTQSVFTVDQYGRRTYGQSRELIYEQEVETAKRNFAWRSSRASRSPGSETLRQFQGERRARDLEQSLKWLNDKDGLDLAR